MFARSSAKFKSIGVGGLSFPEPVTAGQVDGEPEHPQAGVFTNQRAAVQRHVGLIIEEVSGVECKVPAVENTIECQTDLLIVECAGRFLLGG